MYSEPLRRTEQRRGRLTSLPRFGSSSFDPLFDFWKEPTVDGCIRFCPPGKASDRSVRWLIPCSEIDAVESNEELEELIQLRRIQKLIAGD